jgi:hypothetical protein
MHRIASDKKAQSRRVTLHQITFEGKEAYIPEETKQSDAQILFQQDSNLNPLDAV